MLNESELKQFPCCTQNKLGGLFYKHFPKLSEMAILRSWRWITDLCRCHCKVVAFSWYGDDGVSQVWCEKHTPSTPRINYRNLEFHIKRFE